MSVKSFRADEIKTRSRRDGEIVEIEFERTTGKKETLCVRMATRLLGRLLSELFALSQVAKTNATFPPDSEEGQEKFEARRNVIAVSEVDASVGETGGLNLLRLLQNSLDEQNLFHV